jgi:6-phosphogluconolactonase
VTAIVAPHRPEPCVTLTAPVLARADKVYLLIHGAEKRAALDRAMAIDDPERAPIRAVLAAARAPVVFYAA